MSEQVQSPFRVEESAAAKQELLGGPPMQKKKHKKRKASNGRLKKLWRRATTQSKGITSRKEWNEMLELHSDWKTSHQDNPDVSDDPMMGSLPGPAVILSKEPSQDFTNMKNWQATEGSDHRDIILNLIFRQSSSDGAGDGIQKKKKRKLGASGREPMRQSSLINAPTLPSWSNIRNLSGMGGLAVIEICIEDCDPGSPCPLMPSERVKDVTDGKKSPWTTLFGNTNIDTNSDSKVQRSITACKVKLFQGNKHPRCLSDVLMFLPPPVASSEHDTKKQSVDVIDAIYDLRLTPKQMRSEGYPFISGQEESSTDDNKESVENKISAYSKSDVDEMSTDVALDLIKTVSVEVSFGDDDEHVVDHTECEHYVKTFSRNKDASPRRPKIFAIDCEMVQTKANMELARVSVIEYVEAIEGNGNEGDDEKNILVLDELVKPRRDVLDYLTHYSGVTAKMLVDVKTRIESIQLLLLSLIHEEDVIIGHSAENDLRALRLVHNNIVDTSVVFRGDNGRKYSLKHLSNVLLQRQIQNGCGSSGHCSREDAEASLVLALRRAKHGSSFRLKESVKHQNVLDVFQKSKGGDHTSDGNSSESSFAERNERSSVCIGPNDWLTGRSVGNGSQHLLSCESILSSMAMAVPSWLASKKPSRAGMLWAKLICEGSREGFKNELKKQDEIIDSLVTNVSTDTPILVIFQRNYLKANALTRQRKAATNPKATCVWSACQEEEWKQYMSSCRNCEALWIGSSCQQQTKS